MPSLCILHKKNNKFFMPDVKKFFAISGAVCYNIRYKRMPETKNMAIFVKIYIERK